MASWMKKLVENVVLGLFVVIVLSLATTGCDKEKPPRAEITVVDSTGKAIDKARVVLYCVQRPEETRECVIVDTQLTDDVGKANFEFKNPAVLKVDVWKADVVEKETGVWPDIVITYVGDTLCTEGFITLETNEIIEQRMVVTTCNADSK
ncbi:MAG: hypothetical protein CL840_12285 [Crocinitomicaceae bacterium]|nr:hypothetical protein [Crocinitomicaceae bacterium]|tara:strand:- start:2940 stop:3389 length:450 start_codon:yes stop_codon:yes gene_type:complete